VKIETIPIGKINPAPYNPRKDLQPEDAEYQALKRSIERFGYVDPLIWNRRTGHLVGGHQRFKILQAEGLEAADVSVVDLDPDDERALNIALNKIEGAWDMPKLSELLADLAGADYDLSLTGFTEEELNKLLTWDEELEDEALDVVPELPKTAVTQVGDLWVLGKHTLVCGDSTDPAVALRATEQQPADLVFTDPPYGIQYVGKTAEAMVIMNDDLGDAGTRELVANAVRAWPLKKGGAYYVCSCAGETETAFRLGIRDAGYTLRECLVWVKQHFVMGRQDYHWRHESVLYGWADGGPHYFIGDRTQDTVIEEDRPMASRLHPTMKPIALVARFIRNSSRLHDLVFDGFGGSGSTLIAADQVDRRAALVELDPRYCDVIIERWQTVTGGKAHRG
jgi:DNA modification methylase